MVGDGKALYYAAIAEKGSDHPIARAIIEKAKEVYEEIPSADSYDTIPGMGIVAQWNGLTIGVGNDRLVKGFEARASPEIEKEVRKYVSDGYTAVYVIMNNEVLGAVILGDSIRPEAPMVINELRRMGITPIMVTGDNAETATWLPGSWVLTMSMLG
ncbi:HAD-IC family P-type ATPase [Vulcanisaeta sp. JCM 14467]|uniref:HAD-IC family P-type ATPase n=1 Tax=Vulcanisaeta sp. JCM 14467 TaxID=1295370 RepID=UPI000AB6C2C3|nr:HAD-IC family P-type ATPase [Vulcanisaeta sp. JCM 14467]